MPWHFGTCHLVPRQVAIKVLPEAVAADAERLARFQREAEVLASLNHPNIAHVYGLPGRRVRISGSGGVQARWRRNGKELFYLASDNRLMAVPIQVDPSGEYIEPGTPVPLFTTRLAGTPSNDFQRHYMVSDDGQRFLMDTLTEVSIPMTVVLNWKPQP